MHGDPGELWAGCALHVVIQKDWQHGDIKVQLFLPVEDSSTGTYRAGTVDIADHAFSRDTCRWLA
jgi:hypothetical protein